MPWLLGAAGTQSLSGQTTSAAHADVTEMSTIARAVTVLNRLLHFRDF